VRVAVITESFLPTVNGVTTSVCRVLDHLRATGHDAMVVTPSAGAPSKYLGYPVHQVPAIAYRRFPVGLPTPAVQGLLADFEPDVLHAASPFLLGAQGIAAATRLGVPSVAVYQTDVARYAARHGFAAATGLAWRMVRRAHENADVTLVPSSAAQSDLEAAGVQRLARWGRGVDTALFTPNRRAAPGTTALRRRLSPSGEVVVGYVGRVAPEKQLERLRALRGLRGISIAIVGDGPSRVSVARALRGQPVTWLGSRSGTELAEAYAALDVFVHTGTEETFGQTLQEAHASGVPVIAPAVGGPLDLVEHGVDGLLFDPAGSYEAHLRTSVAALAADPALRRRMGEAGRRTVRTRTWDVVCEELIGHYAAAIEGRRVAAALPSPLP
jgi:phosphatidylinositol alpha 1,6-mannosyltransferase